MDAVQKQVGDRRHEGVEQYAVRIGQHPWNAQKQRVGKAASEFKDGEQG